MNMVSDHPAHMHPSWCDRAVCTHPDSLADRGVTEADVPRHLRSAHMATPRTVHLDEHGEVRFTFLPWRFVDEPVTDVVQGVDLICEWATMLLTVGVPIAPAQLPALVDTFTAVRDLATGGDPSRDVKADISGHETITRREAWRRLAALVADGLPDPHEINFRTTDSSSVITVYVDSAADHEAWTRALGLDANPLVALPDGSVVYRSWGDFGGWFMSIAAMVAEAEIAGGDR